MTDKTNVMPGDKAIMINAYRPQNIGALVLVERELVRDEIIQDRFYRVHPGRVRWIVSTLGRPLASGVAGGPVKDYVTVGAAFDEYLRRLPRPDEMPEDDSLPVERPTKETA